MDRVNVEVLGDVEQKVVELNLLDGKKRGSARCFHYHWRDRGRKVWVVQDRDMFDRILAEWWPHLTIVPLDMEYSPQSSWPAVVTLALTREVALLWHRPVPSEASTAKSSHPAAFDGSNSESGICDRQ